MKSLFSFTALALSASFAFAANTTTLSGTVRDFTPGALVPGSSNPDFQAGISGVVTGMVANTLGMDGKPVLVAPSAAAGRIDSVATFAEWFGAAAPSKQYDITLTETAANSGVFKYTNNSFFPINGELLGNYANTNKNYHFTYQIAATFGYKPGTGQTFTFTGDDDVWVFFDKNLGIDLGGVHSAASKTVNLDTFFNSLGGRTEGNYAFDFFFAERHTTDSKLSIETSLVLTPVPEPSTYALMALGLAGVGFVARRKRAAA